MSQVVVAHLIATNFYGGPEKQILTHGLQLDPQRFRFILVSFVEPDKTNQLVELAREKGIEVLEISTGNPFDPRLIKALVQILKQHQVDLLCAHGYKSNVIGRMASWWCRIPQIAVSRGWTAENRRIRFYEKLDRLFLRFNHHIVAVSSGQQRKILAYGIRTTKTSVIRNAIELTDQSHSSVDYRSQAGLADSTILIASAGRLSPEKNQSAMIQVARMVTSRHDNVVFVIFGEGFLRTELEQQIEAAGLTNKFLLPGFRNDMSQLMSQIDIFMLPSFTEGLPNVALEAFANKKTVVATAVGGTPEVVQDKISGYLTTPEDINGMAEAVEQLITNPDLRQQMGEAGYAYISEHFGFEAQTKKYEELYCKAVAESRRHGGAQLKVRY